MFAWLDFAWYTLLSFLPLFLRLPVTLASRVLVFFSNGLLLLLLYYYYIRHMLLSLRVFLPIPLSLSVFLFLPLSLSRCLCLLSLHIIFLRCTRVYIAHPRGVFIFSVFPSSAAADEIFLPAGSLTRVYYFFTPSLMLSSVGGQILMSIFTLGFSRCRHPTALLQLFLGRRLIP